MKVAISGASGLIGSQLAGYLADRGHSISRLVRRQASAAGEIFWDGNETVDRKALEGHDAIIHLAGENIGQRWTATMKKKILESRSRGTRLLAEAAASLSTPPKVFVSSSAIGYYGDRGETPLNEGNGPGQGFLPDVCLAWEKATDPASAKGIRVVHVRTGILVDTKGGALAKMLLPFKMGAGGIMGNGRQYWSWIATPDLLAIYCEALNRDTLQGPVNATAPNPATNAEFTRVLARVLHRPAVFPMPAFAARLALGEMADALLLSSARVLPQRLVEAGFQFQYPELEGALRHAIAAAKTP